MRRGGATGSGRIAAAVLAAALAGAQAEAQPDDAPAAGATPYDYTSPEEMEIFRRCRAAAFYHLDGPEDPASVVPRSVARTLLDQTGFVMAESLLNKTPVDVEHGRRLIEAAESFFLGFNRTIARLRPEMAETAARDRALLGCIPTLWTSVRLLIDDLARWRSAARAGPEPMSPAEVEALRSRIQRQLEGGG